MSTPLHNLRSACGAKPRHSRAPASFAIGSSQRAADNSLQRKGYRFATRLWVPQNVLQNVWILRVTAHTNASPMSASRTVAGANLGAVLLPTDWLTASLLIQFSKNKHRNAVFVQRSRTRGQIQQLFLGHWFRDVLNRSEQRQRRRSSYLLLCCLGFLMFHCYRGNSPIQASKWWKLFLCRC
jgi:hypothetical protein